MIGCEQPSCLPLQCPCRHIVGEVPNKIRIQINFHVTAEVSRRIVIKIENIHIQSFINKFNYYLINLFELRKKPKRRLTSFWKELASKHMEIPNQKPCNPLQSSEKDSTTKQEIFDCGWKWALELESLYWLNKMHWETTLQYRTMPTLNQLKPFYDSAVMKGKSELVKWFHKKGLQCSPDAMELAAKSGHLLVVQFLHENSS